LHWAHGKATAQAQGIDDAHDAVCSYYGGADLGGSLIRNRLWFYAALHVRNNEEQSLGVFQPNGEPGVVDQSKFMRTNKISYQMNQAQRFVFRSEERRVGKECRFWRVAYCYKE